MTDTEIFEELKTIIEKEFGIEKEMIEEDSNLDEDLNITDLEIEDLVEKINSTYDIKISDDQTQKFKKVSDIVTYLYENVDNTKI
jgi:acyl carrier protein